MATSRIKKNLMIIGVGAFGTGLVLATVIPISVYLVQNRVEMSFNSTTDFGPDSNFNKYYDEGTKSGESPEEYFKTMSRDQGLCEIAYTIGCNARYHTPYQITDSWYAEIRDFDTRITVDGEFQYTYNFFVDYDFPIVAGRTKYKFYQDGIAPPLDGNEYDPVAIFNSSKQYAYEPNVNTWLLLDSGNHVYFADPNPGTLNCLYSYAFSSEEMS